MLMPSDIYEIVHHEWIPQGQTVNNISTVRFAKETYCDVAHSIYCTEVVMPSGTQVDIEGEDI